MTLLSAGVAFVTTRTVASDVTSFVAAATLKQDHFNVGGILTLNRQRNKSTKLKSFVKFQIFLSALRYRLNRGNRN